MGARYSARIGPWRVSSAGAVAQELPDRRHRPRLCRPAARRRVRQALRDDRLRHQPGTHRGTAQAQGPHARSRAQGVARGEAPAVHVGAEGPEALPGLHRHRADADRCRQAPGPDATRTRERVGRQGAEARRHRDLRINRISRAAPRKSASRSWSATPGSGSTATSSRDTARSASTRATASTGCRRSARSRPARRRKRPSSSTSSMPRSSLRERTRHPRSASPRRRR